MKNKIIYLLFWILLLASDTAFQLIFKMGALEASQWPYYINPTAVGAYSLLLVSFVVWMQILKTTRLAIALSVNSLLYVTVAFASRFFLHEPLDRKILAGTLTIAVGVAILGYAQSREEPKKNPSELDS